MTRFLTDSERVRLRTNHKYERDGRVRDRIKAVLLSDKGWTPQQIAEALMIDEDTVNRHIREYQTDEKLKPENGGSTEKLDDDQKAELIQHLDDVLYVTVKDICTYVFEKYQISYSVPGMTHWLHHNGFSYKQPKGSPHKADAAKQQEFINQYNDLLKNTPEDEPIEFGDGVHPTMATKIGHGWIRTGKDKIVPTTASRTRMNLMGSINLVTMQMTIGEYDTIDSKAMEAHFRLLKERYPAARKIHLILDQGPYNKSVETKEMAEKYGIKLHFLPPYSPNLNPIERVWKVMNEHARNNVFFKSVGEFKTAIHNFFETTWPQIAMSMVDRINDNFSPVKSASSV